MLNLHKNFASCLGFTIEKARYAESKPASTSTSISKAIICNDYFYQLTFLHRVTKRIVGLYYVVQLEMMRNQLSYLDFA